MRGYAGPVARRLTFAALSAVALVAALVPASQGAAPDLSRKAIRAEYDQVLATLDRKLPGRGPDAQNSAPRSVPTAFGSVLRAEALRARATGSRSALRRARLCGRWLLRNRDIDRDGVVGWGLPARFDAFGDGTTNPENSEYTITTSSVMSHLMDWLELDRGAPRRRVLHTIRLAVEPYLASPPQGLTPSGMFAYSFAAADAPYDVYNVGANMAGQMQRFSGLVRDGTLKRRLRRAADAGVEVLLRARRRSPAGRYYWLYSTKAPPRPNDFGHALITISGLRAYRKAGGRLRRRIGRRRLVDHLREFRGRVGGRAVWLRSPRFRGTDDPLTGIGGLGGAIALGTRERRLRGFVKIALARIRRYEIAPGVYEVGNGYGPRTTVRGQAGTLSTFATYLWDRDPPFLVK